MASRTTHSLGFYEELFAVNLDLKCKLSRQTLERGRMFSVERVISRRKNKYGREYLIKWLGHSKYEASWEPEIHLNETCLNYFENPSPSDNEILHEVSRLRIAIDQSLKCPKKRQRLTVEFRQDVFFYLFNEKGEKHGVWRVLERDAFPEAYLPGSWDTFLDLHGEGTKIKFPVKMRHFISWSPLKHFVGSNGAIGQEIRAFQEKLSLDFIKVTA